MIDFVCVLSPLGCSLNPIQIAEWTRGVRGGADICVRRNDDDDNDNNNERKKDGIVRNEAFSSQLKGLGRERPTAKQLRALSDRNVQHSVWSPSKLPSFLCSRNKNADVSSGQCSQREPKVCLVRETRPSRHKKKRVEALTKSRLRPLQRRQTKSERPCIQKIGT
jgi:hypothetical protein